MSSVKALEKRVDSYCEQNQISGILRITSHDTILMDKQIGFANREEKKPFSDSTTFSFYSLSKPFCVIGLLMLYDRGQVDLDAHPFRYIPEAEGFDKSVTIRSMLYHESGLPDAEFLPEFVEKYQHGYPSVMREHVKALTQYPPVFKASTDMQYASINMILCALIIENVSGLCYAEYMKKYVFSPLCMHTAVVDNETLFVPHRAQGYAYSEGKIIPVEKCHDWLLGAGDIVGTVDDVYALNRAVKHRLLLKKETWDMVLTHSPKSKFGMGCTETMWHGKRRITHNGGHTGFRTLHVYLPDEDFDIIFLSNSGYGEARDDICEMIYETFFEANGEPSEHIEMDKGYI